MSEGRIPFGEVALGGLCAGLSGGGYIGSWHSGLIASMTRGSHSRFDQPLLNQPKAIQALQFLRENSSYLTPRKGIFSAHRCWRSSSAHRCQQPIVVQLYRPG